MMKQNDSENKTGKDSAVFVPKKRTTSDLGHYLDRMTRFKNTTPKEIPRRHYKEARKHEDEFTVANKTKFSEGWDPYHPKPPTRSRLNQPNDSFSKKRDESLDSQTLSQSKSVQPSKNHLLRNPLNMKHDFKGKGTPKKPNPYYLMLKEAEIADHKLINETMLTDKVKYSPSKVVEFQRKQLAEKLIIPEESFMVTYFGIPRPNTPSRRSPNGNHDGEEGRDRTPIGGYPSSGRNDVMDKLVQEFEDHPDGKYTDHRDLHSRNNFIETPSVETRFGRNKSATPRSNFPAMSVHSRDEPSAEFATPPPKEATTPKRGNLVKPSAGKFESQESSSTAKGINFRNNHFYEGVEDNSTPQSSGRNKFKTPPNNSTPKSQVNKAQQGWAKYSYNKEPKALEGQTTPTRQVAANQPEGSKTPTPTNKGPAFNPTHPQPSDPNPLQPSTLQPNPSSPNPGLPEDMPFMQDKDDELMAGAARMSTDELLHGILNKE